MARGSSAGAKPDEAGGIGALGVVGPGLLDAGLLGAAERAAGDFTAGATAGAGAVAG